LSGDIRNNFFVSIRNQGSTNACTGFASAYLMQILLFKLDASAIVSPEYNWYKARELEGTQNRNVGVSLRDTLRVIFDFGVIQEKHWRFTLFNHYRKPTVLVEGLASLFRELIVKSKLKYFNMGYYNVDSCLSAGYPVVCGIMVNKSFYGSNDGIIKDDTPLNSSHAIVLLDKVLLGENYYYKFANSWGEGWGDAGFGYLPVKYFRLHSHNIWSIRIKEVK